MNGFGVDEDVCCVIMGCLGDGMGCDGMGTSARFERADDAWQEMETCACGDVHYRDRIWERVSNWEIFDARLRRRRPWSGGMCITTLHFWIRSDEGHTSAHYHPTFFVVVYILNDVAGFGGVQQSSARISWAVAKHVMGVGVV